MTSEISTFLSDLKEQILYLQELGVENFAVELPELSAEFQNAAPAQIRNPKTEIRNRLERFVPDAPAAAAPPPVLKAPPPVQSEANTARANLLEKSKLSHMSQVPKHAPSISNIQTHNQEQARGEPMPKSKKTEETLSESLFGDISQTLPETGETVEEIRADVGNCTRCPLWEGRTKIVHSTGNLQADLMFVGEAPGADEDQKGEPFVGRAGQLLNKIIEAIGMRREEVFIGNINRCRPPGNRAPTLPEAETCKPFLLREISVVRPKVIVVLGNTACQNLLNTKVGITKLRGNFQDYYGVKVMPTFHPAYLLRDPSKKRETWEDMKKVRDYLNSIK